MRRTATAALVLVMTTAAAAGAQTKPPSPPGNDQTKALNLSAYAELLRGDIRVQKIAIITEVMGFSEAEDKAFWPVYRDYDAEMAKLGDERVALIADYAKHFDSLTDEVADKLARQAIDLEARRQAAKGKFYDKLRSAVGPRTALRALQVEHQLQLLIDLQIAAALPIAAGK
jgi:hypothetical protein